MTPESSAEWEMAIVLPLGVVANQLRRIETQLRLVNMKALEFARERESRVLRALVESRLDGIHDALGSISGLVADIEADLEPKATGSARAIVKDEAVPVRSPVRIDDPRSPPEAAGPGSGGRGSSSDRDD